MTHRDIKPQNPVLGKLYWTSKFVPSTNKLSEEKEKERGAKIKIHIIPAYRAGLVRTWTQTNRRNQKAHWGRDYIKKVLLSGREVLYYS